MSVKAFYLWQIPLWQQKAGHGAPDFPVVWVRSFTVFINWCTEMPLFLLLFLKLSSVSFFLAWQLSWCVLCGSEAWPLAIVVNSQQNRISCVWVVKSVGFRCGQSPGVIHTREREEDGGWCLGGGHCELSVPNILKGGRQNIGDLTLSPISSSCLPDNLYCVDGDVKPCSINPYHHALWM